jgi:predicted GNAT family acetyltransferase
VPPLRSTATAGCSPPATTAGLRDHRRRTELLASEIVGIGTVPAARRQGLGAAVTARLAQDALDLGAQLVLLTAGDDDVARLYESLGFVRLGACGAATLPA